MKIALLVGLVFIVVTSHAVEKEGNHGALSRDITNTKITDLVHQSHSAAFNWCVAGVVSSLSALKLASWSEELGASVKQKIIKRCFYCLVFSTVFSMGAMIKYANKTKQLLEQETYGNKKI